MSVPPLANLELAEKMSFSELARNIRKNLEQAKLTPSDALDPELLAKLVDALEEKSKPPPEMPQAPVVPTLQGQLRLFRITKIEEEQIAAIKKAESGLLSSDTAVREGSERRLKNFRSLQMSPNLRAYLAQRERLNERLAVYEREMEAQSSTRLKIVEHLRADVDVYRRGHVEIPVSKLWWRFLPAGQSDVSALVAEIRALRQRFPHLRYDEERMLYAQTLDPSHIFVGEDDFDGYFAFVFEHTKHVLLENPQEGNAAYVFRQDWMALSRLSKRELLEQYRDLVQRVPHRNTGNWKWYIRQALRPK